jgi:hypothetical protein
VRAADRTRTGIQTDGGHCIAHAQPLAKQRLRHPALCRRRIRGIEEQLGGVVAGLAMDLDQPGEVRSAGIVEPVVVVVVVEPRVRFGDQDQLPRPVVIQPVPDLAGRIQDGFHPGQLRTERGHPGHVARLPDVDVRDLVVCQCERPRRPGVETFHPVLRIHPQQTLGGRQPQLAGLGHPEHGVPIGPDEDEPAVDADVQAGARRPTQRGDDRHLGDPTAAVDGGDAADRRAETPRRQRRDRQRTA